MADVPSWRNEGSLAVFLVGRLFVPSPLSRSTPLVPDFPAEFDDVILGERVTGRGQNPLAREERLDFLVRVFGHLLCQLVRVVHLSQ